MLVPNPLSRDNKDSNYKFLLPTPSWKETKMDQSDYAYFHEDSGSHLVLNSLCRKYETTSVSDLNASLLTGLQNLLITEKKELELFNRKAITTMGHGSMDGVKISFKLTTFMRNNCIYDIALIGVGNSLREEEINDLTKLISSIQFK